MLTKIVRVIVNLPQEVVDALRQLAEHDGTTMTEMLRRSISTQKFLADEIDQGGKVLIEKNKKFRQLIFR